MEQLRLRPIVTLTTDFGLSDHYAGTVKGVIYSRCPDAAIVDICHQVPAFSIVPGAYTIAQAAPYFPAGALHVVVVDPGVGTARRPILVEASGQYFIAPDNGVLSFILKRDPKARVREIANRSLFLPVVSSTFHGRDVFAAVAAALAAREVAAHDVGPAIPAAHMLDGLDPRQTGERAWEGKVLSVDRFGNVITNFAWERFLPAEIRIKERRVTAVRNTFGDVAPGEVFLYPGSSGNIEIGINQASAAAALGLVPGELLHLAILTGREL